MPNRQKIYVGLAISAGVCTGIALFFYVRHRRQTALAKASNNINDITKTTSILSSIRSRRGHEYTDITTPYPDVVNGQSDSIRFQTSEGAIMEVDMPGGNATLTPDQAIILTQYLDDTNNDIERLHRILTNIANAATFAENQINLANAGCISRLREILSKTDNDTTQSKVLLALNNLVLNESTIMHFSGVIRNVINLCRAISSKSLVRLHGLNLLINMSVLEYLHSEFLQMINDIGTLIESTFDSNEEMLSAGKILVNLSTNHSNLEHLLKLKGMELKTIVHICTPSKKSYDPENSSKLEEILLRYLTFYCNLADIIIGELKQAKTTKTFLTDPIAYRQGTIYFELFDHDNQIVSKSILRPQYSSGTVNSQIKRLRQAMDTIRQVQFDSSVSAIQDEFNTTDHPVVMLESSTPKKIVTPLLVNSDNPFVSLENEMNEQFDEHDDDDDDKTILAGSSTSSAESFASFRSAVSTIEDNPISPSPETSLST